MNNSIKYVNEKIAFAEEFSEFAKRLNSLLCVKVNGL